MARGKINKPLSTRGWKYSVLPSLRPPTLSRVVCCLWSTVLYTECSSYRTPCVPTHYGFASLRRVTSLPRLLVGFPSLAYILYHIFLDLSIPFSKKVENFFVNIVKNLTIGAGRARANVPGNPVKNLTSERDRTGATSLEAAPCLLFS